MSTAVHFHVRTYASRYDISGTHLPPISCIGAHVDNGIRMKVWVLFFHSFQHECYGAAARERENREGKGKPQPQHPHCR
jgi:hypothetical protein